MNILDEKELIKLLSDFYGSNFDDATIDKQQEYISNYRKVELETNKDIIDAGGVDNWYASGKGRLFK